MGTFSYEITLIAASGDRSEAVSALVDTGATFTSVPAPILERLGIEPVSRVRLRMANGETVEQQMGEVAAELDGVRRTILCIFSPPEAPPLIGAHTPEALVLAVEPRLVPTEALWLSHQA